MTRIDDLFAQSVELAEADAPPSPLRAVQLFRAGRRRRTRLTAILAAMSVALGAGTVGAVAAIATGASRTRHRHQRRRCPSRAQVGAMQDRCAGPGLATGTTSTC